MRAAILIGVAILGVSGTAFAQSLVDVAKRTEEQPAAAAAKAADDKNTAEKKTEPVKVYTNKDLKASAPEPIVEEPSALAVLQNGAAQMLPPPAEPGSENIVEMRATARRYFARALGDMSGRIRSWASQSETLATACSKASYDGLTRAMFQGHASVCRSQLYDLRLRKAGIERFKGQIEEAARKKGIFPGVMRELFIEIGWTP